MTSFWNEDNKSKLLNCLSNEELIAEFPGRTLESLITRRGRVRRETGWIAPAVERVEGETPPPSSVPLTVHNRVLRQLDEVKRKQADYLDTLYQAVSDAMAGFEVGVVPSPRLGNGKAKNSEVCVPLLSDIQLAKVTADYNTEVAEKRLYAYARKIVRLAEVQRADHPVTKCHVMALGDLIEGVDIFPGQQWLIDAGLYRQICVDGPRMLTGFFRYLLQHFDTVECTWVIGNHGRIGRKGEYDPETNGDRMLGKFVQMAMAGEPRFKLNVPDGHGDRHWYAMASEGKWKAMLFHGDQIRGHSGIPWYGFHKSVAGWASGGLPAPDHEFQTALCGHFHQACRIPINKREVYVNGSTESSNQYASEQLKAMSDPQQWCLFVSPKDGRVTASYLVDLR